MLIVVSWSGILLIAMGLGSRRRGDGFRTWGWALALHTVANLLIAARGMAPAWMSVTLGNSCLMASSLVFTAGLLEFFGRRLPRIFIVGPTLFVAVAWTLLRHHYTARVGLAGALLGTSNLATAVLLYRLGRQGRDPAQWMVLGGFSLYALLFFSRLFQAILRPESLGEHTSTTVAQSFAYVLLNLFVLPTSIGFLLMLRERAERESELRKVELERLNETLEQRVESQVREIVERSRQVERLNVELRLQVQERSDELTRVLARMAQPSPAPSTLAEGDTLGERFAIESLLGRGGMGTVYRALDKATGERVALKVITTRSAAEFDSVYRFLREAHASARVDHPAIVHARLIDVADDRLFQVFELVDGVPLDRVMQARRSFPAGPVARLGGQLAEALAAAHAAGVVHRDIKPANIMVTRGRANVRLLDFGISKLRVQGQSSSGWTQSGALMGTPAYMAPEQVTDSAAVVDRSDIYALGVILFELLAGRLPFENSTMAASMAARLLGDAPDLRALAPWVPAALAALVQRCLARSPDARPSAAEIARELSALAGVLGDPGQSLLDARTESLPPALLADAVMLPTIPEQDVALNSTR